jgi:hypothetical protein
MNTETNIAAAPAAAANIGTIASTPVGQINEVREIDNRLGELQNTLNNLLARREELRLSEEQEKREKAMKLPAEWGFDGMDSFISFLRSVSPKQQAAKGLRSGRAFSPELIAELKKQIREGKTAKQVKSALGISFPSYYAMKSRLGLTKKYSYPKGRKAARRGHKSRPQMAGSELAAA